MPLSTASARKPLHTRQVTCEGFLRDDGLIDIEGHLLDTKPFDFPNTDRGGVIRAGEALHGMSIRITLDQQMTIVDAEAMMDYTPYNYCKTIAPVFKQIVGLKIGPGWRVKIKEVMGGIKGCTHLTELLGPMATTAFQTMVSIKGPDEQSVPERIRKKGAPLFINTCHSHAADSPVVKQHWPEFYRDKKAKPPS